MAHREVTMLEVKEVLKLWLGGLAKNRIASGPGPDVRTVSRYLREAKAVRLQAGQGDPGIACFWRSVRPGRAPRPEG
jgi:hypothetical protein